MTSSTQAFAAWAMAGTSMAVAAALVLRTGRQRTAINEALHELRRPLQALALAVSSPVGGGVVESSTRLAAAALERLDREVNGGGLPGSREPVRCETALRSAVGRWRARVALGGGSLELCWWAGEAAVVGDRSALEQAVDNLIVNAIEHGGPQILVEGRRKGDRLLISVADSGRGAAPGRWTRSASPRRDRRATLRHAGRPVATARVTGRRRRGHGLAVVRRTAAGHRGRFVLQRGDDGSVAILDLPLHGDGVGSLDAAA